MKSITNNIKYNEYNYNPAATKFQCIFAWGLITVYIYVEAIAKFYNCYFKSIYKEDTILITFRLCLKYKI